MGGEEYNIEVQKMGNLRDGDVLVIRSSEVPGWFVDQVLQRLNEMKRDKEDKVLTLMVDEQFDLNEMMEMLDREQMKEKGWVSMEEIYEVFGSSGSMDEAWKRIESDYEVKMEDLDIDL